MGEPVVETQAETKVKVEGEAEGAAAETKNGTSANNGTVEKTAEELGLPDLETEIVNQVEYYFGDVNLQRDKFLLEQIKLEDGWVPIEVMLRFKRLESLSRVPATIVGCLKSGSKLVEVNEDGTKIRRSPSKPLPERTEEWLKAVNERTVYCKGFPKDLNTVGPYIAFFKSYGPVEHINLRRYKDNVSKQMLFKGSAYVLFESKELAEKFLALESVKFNDTELIRMTQEAHSQEKKKEKDERWGKKVKKPNAKEEDAKVKKEFSKGCILKFANITNSELTREEIKSALTDLGADVGFIDFNKGETEALVRLRSTEDGAASQFVKKLEEGGEKVKFGEEEMEPSVLEGVEEDAFLEKSRQSMERFQNKSQRGKKNFHRGGGRGYKGGHKRGRSPGREGPPAKKQELSS